MAREKKADKLARALEVERRMGEHYPEPECALHYRTPQRRAVFMLIEL